MSEHTPLPWTAGGAADQEPLADWLVNGEWVPYASIYHIEIAENKDSGIAEFRLRHIGHTTGSNAPADGEFICRACNSHDKLVAACRIALRSLESQRKYIVDDRQAEGHNRDARRELDTALSAIEGRVP